MRTILCFGDSNTWGYMSETGQRFAPSKRWSGILREALGDEYFVIEEGLNGRTTVFDDPQEKHRSGKEYLAPCLESHSPLDLVIIMLGTNDLKDRFRLSAQDIAAGMEKLLRMIRGSAAGPGGIAPKILLMSPAPVGYEPKYEDFLGSHDTSAQLAALYSALAEKHGCAFFDAGSIAEASDLPDGIHLSEEAHARLGAKIVELVKTLI